MAPKTVTIEDAVRPPIPTKRVVSDVALRYDSELNCKVVKIEYGEVSGSETVGWRTILTGDDAVSFAEAWVVDKGTAVELILQRGDLARQ